MKFRIARETSRHFARVRYILRAAFWVEENEHKFLHAVPFYMFYWY